MIAPRSTCLLLFLLLVPALGLLGCDSDAEGSENDDLVGRWGLVEVNGFSVAPGLLEWAFTSSTLRTISDLDCETLATYRRSGNTLTLTLTSVEGDECGEEVGDTGTITVEVDGDRLEADVMPDEPDGEAVFERL